MSESLFVSKHGLTLAAAKKAADATLAAAAAAGIHVAVAVVDEGGNLFCAQRMDQAGYGCVDIAIAKAKAATRFKTETMGFQQGVASGFHALMTLGVVTLGGGVPILYNGAVVGAVGVSGGAPEQDAEAAKTGIAALLT